MYSYMRIKQILLILATIVAIAILNSMPSDSEVQQLMQQENNNIRLELAKQYQLEQYRNIGE